MGGPTLADSRTNSWCNYQRHGRYRRYVWADRGSIPPRVTLPVLGVPVALALLVPSILYVIYFDIPILLVAQNMSWMLYSFTLLTVPLFIFVGSLMNSGQTDRMFEFANTVVGHYKGGLAFVNILASLIFSGISGSALAGIGGVGKILMKTMRDNGYGNAYSAAITGASSTVGSIFPPSIPLIIYGILAEV